MTGYSTSKGIEYGSWILLIGVVFAYWPLMATGFSLLLIAGACRLFNG